MVGTGEDEPGRIGLITCETPFLPVRIRFFLPRMTAGKIRNGCAFGQLDLKIDDRLGNRSSGIAPAGLHGLILSRGKMLC